jgi:hypothetical protein
VTKETGKSISDEEDVGKGFVSVSCDQEEEEEEEGEEEVSNRLECLVT